MIYLKDFMLNYKNIVFIIVFLVVFVIGYSTSTYLTPRLHFIVEYRNGTDSTNSIGPMPLEKCLAIIKQHALDIKNHKLNFPNDPIEALHLWCLP